MTPLSQALPPSILIESVSPHLNVQDLISLSKVNKYFNVTLSNQPFFKNLLNYRHPNLIGAKAIEGIEIIHPSSSWKIICCLLEERKKPTSAFIFRELPNITRCCRAFLEKEQKALFGDHDQNPASPICQVWKKLTTSQQTMNDCQFQFNYNLEETLKPVEALVIFLYPTLLEESKNESPPEAVLKSIWRQLTADTICFNELSSSQLTEARQLFWFCLDLFEKAKNTDDDIEEQVALRFSASDTWFDDIQRSKAQVQALLNDYEWNECRNKKAHEELQELIITNLDKQHSLLDTNNVAKKYAIFFEYYFKDIEHQEQVLLSIANLNRIITLTQRPNLSSTEKTEILQYVESLLSQDLKKAIKKEWREDLPEEERSPLGEILDRLVRPYFTKYIFQESFTENFLNNLNFLSQY